MRTFSLFDPGFAQVHAHKIAVPVTLAFGGYAYAIVAVASHMDGRSGRCPVRDEQVFNKVLRSWHDLMRTPRLRAGRRQRVLPRGGTAR
jgi:hypothetical protein